MQFVVYIVSVLKFEAIFLLVCISKPTIFFSRDGNNKCIWAGFGILKFEYGKDSVRSDMAYPILYLVSFLDAADTKPIEQQFWKERWEQSVKHKYFATQI